jgi:hypothetical protein
MPDDRAMMAGVLSGVVAATSGPVGPFFIVQPTVSPAGGDIGQTFTATPGSVANGSVTSRKWLLNGSLISSGLTATPSTSGTLTYQEFAGAVGSATLTMPVAASATAFFGANNQSWGDTSTPVFGKAA